MEKILTVPSVIENREQSFLTGNHYVSLPKISENGCIESIAFLSGRLRALQEFRGSMVPFAAADGERLPFTAGGYEHDFLPTFKAAGTDIQIGLRYVAPEKLRGFLCCFRLKSKKRTSLELGFQISVSEVLRRIFHSVPLEGRVHSFHYTWTDTLITEFVSGESFGGFGISCRGAEIDAASGRIVKKLELEAGEEREVLFFVSVGAETDGIGLGNMDMQRRGAAPARLQEQILDSRHICLDNKVLEGYANFNSNFCLYYSCGMTLDTDEFCLLTSKSPAYYVSSAFWSRDSFLWAFPALLKADREIAEKALFAGFGKYLDHIGIHALYIDGTVLYPGFELDELAAPVIALKRYVEETGNRAILQDERISQGLSNLRSMLEVQFDSTVGLFRTELDSSDDPVQYPFNIYSNALCVSVLRFLGEDAAAERLEKNIERLSNAEHAGKTLYAYSTDGVRTRLYDDPPGSLLLLPLYMNADAQKYADTVEYICSKENPYYYECGALFGMGCEHTPYPWVASLINVAIGTGKADGRLLRALERAAEACPTVSESFRVSDGALNTGDAFATMAGYISSGIFQIFER